MNTAQHVGDLRSLSQGFCEWSRSHDDPKRKWSSLDDAELEFSRKISSLLEDIGKRTYRKVSFKNEEDLEISLNESEREKFHSLLAWVKTKQREVEIDLNRLSPQHFNLGELLLKSGVAEPR